MSDKQLIKRVVSGDRRAAQKLIETTYPAVYRMVLHLTARREAAEDLTQQSFSRAWQALPEFRAESSFLTWMRRIAYREYLHWRRDVPLELPIHDTVPAPGNDDEATERVVLESAIAKLPEDLRVTFLLVVVEEFSVKETAGALDIPEGTVKSRLFTARARLRSILEPNWSIQQNEVNPLLAKENQQ